MRICRLHRFSLLAIALALLAACGSKGPLTLPSDEPAPAPLPAQ